MDTYAATLFFDFRTNESHTESWRFGRPAFGQFSTIINAMFVAGQYSNDYTRSGSHVSAAIDRDCLAGDVPRKIGY